jgi:thiamine biosynthesis protein ThiS
MRVTINGEQREVDVSTVAELVAALGLKPDRVAIEQNLEIVSRGTWEVAAVSDGDRFEIVHFVGGGTGAI